MGRESGFIAVEVGIAGGAEQVIIPERKIDIENLCQDLHESLKRGKRSNIIVVAEGNQIEDTINIAKYVEPRLKVECRVCTLGHIQRGGSPTSADRILASNLGIAAVDGLINRKQGHAVGEIHGRIAYTPFRQTWENKKQIASRYLKAIPILSQ